MKRFFLAILVGLSAQLSGRSVSLRQVRSYHREIRPQIQRVMTPRSVKGRGRTDLVKNAKLIAATHVAAQVTKKQAAAVQSVPQAVLAEQIQIVEDLSKEAEVSVETTTDVGNQTADASEKASENPSLDESPVANTAQDIDPIKEITAAQIACHKVTQGPIVSHSKFRKAYEFLKKTEFYLKNPLTAMQNTPWKTVKAAGKATQECIDEVVHPALKAISGSVWRNGINYASMAATASFGVPGFIAKGIWSIADKSFWLQNAFELLLSKSPLGKSAQSCLRHAFTYFFNSYAGLSPIDYTAAACDNEAKSDLYDAYFGDQTKNEAQTLNDAFWESIKKDATISGFSSLEKDYKIVALVGKLASAAIAFHSGSWISASGQVLSLFSN